MCFGCHFNRHLRIIWPKMLATEHQCPLLSCFSTIRYNHKEKTKHVWHNTCYSDFDILYHMSYHTFFLYVSDTWKSTWLGYTGEFSWTLKVPSTKKSNAYRSDMNPGVWFPHMDDFCVFRIIIILNIHIICSKYMNCLVSILKT